MGAWVGRWVVDGWMGEWWMSAWWMGGWVWGFQEAFGWEGVAWYMVLAWQSVFGEVLVVAMVIPSNGSLAWKDTDRGVVLLKKRAALCSGPTLQTPNGHSPKLL